MQVPPREQRCLSQGVGWLVEWHPRVNVEASSSEAKQGSQGARLAEVLKYVIWHVGLQLGRLERTRRHGDGFGADGLGGLDVLRRIPDHHHPTSTQGLVQAPSATGGSDPQQLGPIFGVIAEAAERGASWSDPTRGGRE